MMCCSCNVGESCQVCGKHPNKVEPTADAKLIDLCMRMTSDVPGRRLDDRIWWLKERLWEVA